MPYRSLSRSDVEGYITRFAKTRVMVLGDIMLDRYFWGDVERISPEAPVPVVKVTRRSERLGGAANVAGNLSALGLTVSVAGLIGEDRAGESVMKIMADERIGTDGVITDSDRETTEKVRIIARSQQVVRADFENENPPAPQDTSRMTAMAAQAAKSHDALVISDYGKGVITEAMLSDVIPVWRRAGKPVLVDPHIPHFSWYRGASVATPNTREAESATGIAFGATTPDSDLVFSSLRDIGMDALLVTRGEHGMSLYFNATREVHIPTMAKEVYDVTGAGDTVISVLAAGLAAGLDIESSVIMANQGAGEVVKEVGTSILSIETLLNSCS